MVPVTACTEQGAACAAIDDDSVVALVVLVAMFVIPALARRVFPALR